MYRISDETFHYFNKLPAHNKKRQQKNSFTKAKSDNSEIFSFPLLKVTFLKHEYFEHFHADSWERPLLMPKLAILELMAPNWSFWRVNQPRFAPYFMRLSMAIKASNFAYLLQSRYYLACKECNHDFGLEKVSAFTFCCLIIGAALRSRHSNYAYE